jgi:GAF domain-containing protein
VRCPRCEHENRPQATFCEACSTPLSANPNGPPAPSYAEITSALSEALEQQTATAEILRVIASSPTDLRPVMEAVAENAARVCGATDSSIYRREGEHLRLVARHGSLHRPLAIGDTFPVTRDRVGGRAVCDRRTIHVEDIMAAEAEFPETLSRTRQAGSLTRTMVVTPLLREGTPLGVIYISRGPEVRPFSAKQIALLETFANQAVIAIENVRLFQELRERTAELTRSVEQLTALGDVSRAVSSTLDLDAVLDTIVTRANQLAGTDGCTIFEYDEAAEAFRLRASRYADPREAAVLDPIGRATPIPKGQGLAGRAALRRERSTFRTSRWRGPMKAQCGRRSSRRAIGRSWGCRCFARSRSLASWPSSARHPATLPPRWCACS